MFEIGDYVVYGFEGVCRVEEIGHPKMSGLDPTREYYRLCSHARGSVIYTPVDGKIAIRSPISKEQAEALLEKAKALAPLDDVPTDGRRAGDYYKELLQEHSFERLMRLCKTMQLKQQQLVKNRRSVNATEQRNWKAAEDMLVDELSFALEEEPATMRQRLRVLFE